MNLHFLASCFGILAITLSTFANKALAATDVKSQVRDYLYAFYSEKYPDAAITIDVNLPNTQLNIRNCRDLVLPPLNRLPAGGRQSLRVSCNSPRWSSYIATKAYVMMPTVVTRIPIARNQFIQAKHLIITAQDITRVRQGHFSRPEDIIGLQARRNIAASTLLTPSLLSQPTLVEKDDAVVIEAGSSALTVTSHGIALQSGKLGKQIRVKNSRSGKTIRAYVIGRGRVSTKK